METSVKWLLDGRTWLRRRKKNSEPLDLFLESEANKKASQGPANVVNRYRHQPRHTQVAAPSFEMTCLKVSVVFLRHVSEICWRAQ